MTAITQKRTDTSRQIDVKVSSPVSDIQASHALVTNVEFASGKKSSIVTLFNASDFSFEEINIGVNTALNRQNWLGIIDIKTILYRFNNGMLTKAIEFYKHRKQ